MTPVHHLPSPGPHPRDSRGGQPCADSPRRRSGANQPPSPSDPAPVEATRQLGAAGRLLRLRWMGSGRGLTAVGGLRLPAEGEEAVSGTHVTTEHDVD